MMHSPSRRAGRPGYLGIAMRSPSQSIVTVVLAFTCTSLYAQDLVIDPGLEDTLKCPLTIGRFYHPTNANERYIKDWRATTLASPDLHNLCGFNGYQPRTGEGYAGIILYDPTEYREYITALMNPPMQAGQCYYVECWVALSTGSTVAVDEVQFHFSESVPLSMAFPPPGPLPLAVHLQADAAATAATYQRVCGLYTAAGGETAVTIGNFQDNANTTLTTVSAVGQVQSYYYIDDLSVTLLDLGPDQIICAGEQALIVPNIQCDALDYQWSTGSVAQTLATGSAGSYSLSISGNGSCSAIDQITIAIDPCAGIVDLRDGSLQLSPVPVARGEYARLLGLRAHDMLGVISTDGRPAQAHIEQNADGIRIATDALVPGTYIVRTTLGRAWRMVVQ